MAAPKLSTVQIWARCATVLTALLVAIGCNGCDPTKPRVAADQATENQLDPTQPCGGGAVVDPENGGRRFVCDIECVAVAPDAKRGISACGDTLTLWRLPDGAPIRSFRAGRQPQYAETGPFRHEILRIAVNWKHDILLAADWECIRAWDLAKGRHLQHFPIIQLSAVAVSPDGEHAYTCGWDPSKVAMVKVWSLRTGKQVRTVARTTGVVSGAEWYTDFNLLEDGACAVLASNAGNVALWDLVNDKALWTRDLGVRLMATTPEGDLTLIAPTQGRQFLLLGANGKQIGVVPPDSEAKLGLTPKILALVPPDAKRVLIAGIRGELVVWDLAKNAASAVLSRLSDTAESEVHSLAISGNGELALVGRGRGVLEPWDLSKGKRIALLQSPQ